MCVYRTRRLHMAVHLWLSHRLSMLVILVYHISCRCARENLKIFRFSKGKRGLGQSPILMVFCVGKRLKKIRKRPFGAFSLLGIFIHDAHSQNFTIWCCFCCNGLVFIDTFVVFCGFPNNIRLQVIVTFK